MRAERPGAASRSSVPTNLEGRQLLTDKYGRFELKGIMPGLIYAAGVVAPEKRSGRTLHPQAHGACTRMNGNGVGVLQETTRTARSSRSLE